MRPVFAALCALALAGCSARAAPPAASPAPVLAELFTSQSCSSCPPAETLFRDLAQRPDLVTLEWHVDYWDDFNDGAGGRWKDPYSSRAATERQAVYSRRIRGAGVFTPQAVIGGAVSATGFDRAAIGRAVDRLGAAAPPVALSATRTASGVAFSLAHAPADADRLLVTFRREIATRVADGENHGRQLASAHVVTGVRRLAAADSLSAPPPAPGEGCALIVQEKDQGAVLAAAYCPA